MQRLRPTENPTGPCISQALFPQPTEKPTGGGGGGGGHVSAMSSPKPVSLSRPIPPQRKKNVLINLCKYCKSLDNVRQSVIGRLWQMFQETGRLNNRRRSGRPRSTTQRDDWYLTTMTLRQRRAIARQPDRRPGERFAHINVS